MEAEEKRKWDIEVPRYLWRALEGDALARGRGYKELNKDISSISLFPCWKISVAIFGKLLDGREDLVEGRSAAQGKEGGAGSFHVRKKEKI